MQSVEFVTRYEQFASGNLLTAVRDVILPPLALLDDATGQTVRSLKKNRVQFLYFHHVFEDEEDDFRALLKRLSEDHRFIGYSEAVERIWRGYIDAPYVAISFDDGMKSCLRAAQIMEASGIKACFFLCPSLPGETDPQQIERFCAERLQVPPVEFMSWDDVETLARAGHEIGSHTLTHANLARLSASQLEDEVGASFEMLADRVGEVKHFSWPFGRFSHFGPAAARTVFETGFQSCASAERGCHVAQLNGRDLCIRRTVVVAKWPIRNTLYFLSRYSQSASIHNNGWPKGWRGAIQ